MMQGSSSISEDEILELNFVLNKKHFWQRVIFMTTFFMNIFLVYDMDVCNSVQL
jgi:hypothetical protein